MLVFFVLSCRTAYVLYYCNMCGWIWWDWSLILRTFFQCFDAVGWVIWSVKTLPRYKPYSTEPTPLPYSKYTGYTCGAVLAMVCIGGPSISHVQANTGLFLWICYLCFVVQFLPWLLYVTLCFQETSIMTCSKNWERGDWTARHWNNMRLDRSKTRSLSPM